MFKLNRELYAEGFREAVLMYKQAMVDEGQPAGQSGVPSKTMGPEQALDTTTPFGGKTQPSKKNLVDIVMKDGGQGQGTGKRGPNRFSHGPSSTVSGQGADNYSG